MKPVAIIGIGNILLGDEGVGVRVIEQLQKMELPDGVEAVDAGTAGADMLETLAHRRKVIVVDAMRSDAPPGTVWRFTPEALVQDGIPMISLHEFGLFEALRAARQLGIAPKEVVIFGIAPKTIGFGLGLSDEVERAIPRVIEATLKEAEG